MKKQLICLLSIFLLVGCQQLPTVSSSDTTVSVIADKDFSLTKDIFLTEGLGEKRMSKVSNQSFSDRPLTQNNILKVDTSATMAQVDAFGAALTHSSAHQILLYKNKDERKAVLEDLFSSKGADFNTVRIPIGASDFHNEEHVFTCCDTKGDDGDLLKYFTLSHDQEIIQVIKEIYEIKPDLKIIAAPWSAPSWMKTGSKPSSKDPDGPSLCGGYLNNQYLNTFCDYLTKFCYQYEDQGIDINYLSLENEATFNGADYPCMIVTPSQASTIALSLNTTLPQKTKLLAYDHNCEDGMYEYLGEEFAKESISSLFSGIAIHGYGRESIPTGTANLRELYPDKKVYMTEITEWEHGSTFAKDLMYVCKNTTIKALNNGLSGTIYWNLALDSLGKPNLGQYSICYGVVNIDTRDDGTLSYTKNPAYYGLSHISRILNLSSEEETNSLKVDTNDSSLLACAFKTGDDFSFVVCNPTSEKADYSIEIDGHYFSSQLEASSVISIRI